VVPIQDSANFSIYDLREPSTNPFPPQTYVAYLQDATVRSKIGAQTDYQACPDAPFNQIVNTGDSKPASLFKLQSVLANHSQTLVLSSLLLVRSYRAVFEYSSGRVTLVRLPPFCYSFAFLRIPLDDSLSVRFSTDWVCNTAGVQEVLSKVQFAQSAEFNSEPLIPYNVHGVQHGVFKTAGPLSFLNVLESGHQIPAYYPALALQAFMQTMNQQPLSST
jgi:hypothetical protein